MLPRAAVGVGDFDLEPEFDIKTVWGLLLETQAIGVFIGFISTAALTLFLRHQDERAQKRALKVDLTYRFLEAEHVLRGTALHFVHVLMKCKFDEFDRPAVRSAPYIVYTRRNFALSEEQIALISNTLKEREDRRVGKEGFSTDLMDFFRAADMILPLVSEHNRRLEVIDHHLVPFSNKITPGIDLSFILDAAELSPLMPYFARMDVLIYQIARISIDALQRSIELRQVFFKSYTRKKRVPEYTAAGNEAVTQLRVLFDWWAQNGEKLSDRYGGIGKS